MAVLGSPMDLEAESEPVLLEGDDDNVTFTLDDGTEITFPRHELVDAVYATADSADAERRAA